MTSWKPVTEEDYERSIDEYDLLMHSRVKSKWIVFETTLFNSKWFDYRFLHPVQATLRYVEAYVEVYRRIFAESIDVNRAPYIRPFKLNLFDPKFDQNTFAGLWRGRQVADAIGMPYETFIDLAFRTVLRHWRQRFLPRPVHLYAEDDIEKVVAKWGELQTVKTLYSSEPEYFVNNYVGSRAQNDHHEWLLGQISAREDPAFLTNRLVNEEHLLPIEKLVSRFGQNRVDQMLSL